MSDRKVKQSSHPTTAASSSSSQAEESFVDEESEPEVGADLVSAGSATELPRDGESAVQLVGDGSALPEPSRSETPRDFGQGSGAVVARDAIRYMLNRYVLQSGETVPSSIGVVAGQHGDGTTTFALAVTEILAHDFDLRTCYLDMSWFGRVARPAERGSKRRRAKRKPLDPAGSDAVGLGEIQAGRVSVSGALWMNGDGPISTIGIGAASPDQIDGLGRGPVFDSTIAEIRRSVDVLVIDFPPIIANGDSLSLLRHCDASVHVVRYGSTTSDMAEQVRDELGSIPSLGAVLNQYKPATPRFFDRIFPH